MKKPMNEDIPIKGKITEAIEWFKSLPVEQRQSIRWILGDEIGCMTDEKYIEAYEKAKRQNF